MQSRRTPMALPPGLTERNSQNSKHPVVAFATQCRAFPTYTHDVSFHVEYVETPGWTIALHKQLWKLWLAKIYITEPAYLLKRTKQSSLPLQFVLPPTGPL